MVLSVGMHTHKRMSVAKLYIVQGRLMKRLPFVCLSVLFDNIPHCCQGKRVTSYYVYMLTTKVRLRLFVARFQDWILIGYVNLQTADNRRTFYPTDISNSFCLIMFFFSLNNPWKAEKRSTSPPFAPCTPCGLVRARSEAIWRNFSEATSHAWSTLPSYNHPISIDGGVAGLHSVSWLRGW